MTTCKVISQVYKYPFLAHGMFTKPCCNSELSKEIRENMNGLHQELQNIHMSLVELGDEMDGVFRGVTEFRESTV